VEPGRTPYDINFRLFRFPIRIHPLFWLGAGILGANYLQKNIFAWLIWVLAVFISILVHELGHAVAYRRFGSYAWIVLYVFGGLAVPSNAVYGRGRRIIVYLAGPITGFLLAGVTYGAIRLFPKVLELSEWLNLLFVFLIMINIYWNVMNLLPIHPLDGGQISREICERLWRGRGLPISFQISFWVAAVVALYSLVCVLEIETKRHVLLDQLPWWFPVGSLYMTFFFGLLAAQSYIVLQQLRRGMHFGSPDDRLPWER
jgi:Zn-dependent protease